jgi:hypothetical protein
MFVFRDCQTGDNMVGSLSQVAEGHTTRQSQLAEPLVIHNSPFQLTIIVDRDRFVNRFLPWFQMYPEAENVENPGISRNSIDKSLFFCNYLPILS